MFSIALCARFLCGLHNAYVLYFLFRCVDNVVELGVAGRQRDVAAGGGQAALREEAVGPGRRGVGADPRVRGLRGDRDRGLALVAGDIADRLFGIGSVAA